MKLLQILRTGVKMMQILHIHVKIVQILRGGGGGNSIRPLCNALVVCRRHPRRVFVLACLPWLALLAYLAEVSWFLCDDAFISFRYVRNLLEGHGLVFNPGERVEGYSNFLWVLELAAIWGLFGLRPEHVAPWLSVACTVGTLAALWWWIACLPALPHRGLVGWMALGLLCSSATFAVWTSGGGLETRQFTFFIVVAVVCLSLYRDRRWGLLASSLSLAAAAYTRPEGPLIAAVCFGWFAIERMVKDRRLRLDGREVLYLVAPFATLVAAHFLFRYAYYGEWLPNTYYAKYVRPWYEMGVRYLWAAALATGLYLLIPLAFLALRERWRKCRDGTYALVLLLVGVHMAYVARIGGDYFEWRPLAFYWPLLALPAAVSIMHLGSGAAYALRTIFAPRAWLPGTRICTLVLFIPVLFYASAMQTALLFEADRTGGRNVALDGQNAGWLLRAPGMEFLNDLSARLRRRLTGPMVGNRFASHREFAKGRMEWWQPYDGVALRLPHDAVTSVGSIGIMPYYLSNLTVIDLNGLADKIVARNPNTRLNRQRTMAHDRCPPAGYAERRGVNFIPYPAAASAAEAHLFAPYAAPAGPNLWLPFETNKPREWVEERFAVFSYAEQREIDAVPAVIVSAGAPVVSERFTVRLSDATRSVGFTKRTQWRWQRGSDATGWGWAFGGCGSSYQYVPSASDVGLHLRAFTYYTDPDGHRVKAITSASDPVVGR